MKGIRQILERKGLLRYGRERRMGDKRPPKNVMFWVPWMRERKHGSERVMVRIESWKSRINQIETVMCNVALVLSLIHI